MSPFRASGLATLIAASLGPGCLGQGFIGNTGASNGGNGSGGGQTSGSTTGSLSCLAASSSSLDFGYVAVGMASTMSVELVNQCASPVTAVGATISGIDAELFTVAGTPATLGPFGSAAVHIRYGPLGLETRSAATVVFAGSDGARSTLNVFGEPVVSSLRLSPATIDFGFVDFKTAVIRCTTLTNTSSAAVDVTGVASFNTQGGAFAVSRVDDSTPPSPAPIPVSIPGGGSARVCFSFTPPIVQQYLGQATLTTDDPAVAAPTVQLTGWGGGPQISCNPTRIDFGETLDHSLTTVPILCTNSGSALPDAGLVIEQLEIMGPDADAFSAKLDSAAPQDGFAPGQTFQIDLSFMPGDAGTDDAALTLVIETNAGNFEIMFTAQGEGLNIPPCQFVVSPPSLDFASEQVGDTSPPLSFEVQNVGTNDCTVQGLAINGDATGSFHILATSLSPDGTGKYTIPPAATHVDAGLTIALDFAPTVEGQSFSAEVAFSISDPSDPDQVVPLSGSEP